MDNEDPSCEADTIKKMLTVLVASPKMMLYSIA